MDTQNRKAGRRPGKNETKIEIIAAAQKLFTKVSYEQTTIRDVAKRAHVDPALIMHYFGSKQELFIAAMTPPQKVPQKIAKALEGDTETLGLRLATLFIGIIESKKTNQIIISVLRAVIQVPGAASLLKILLVRPILNTFKHSEKLDHPELRATLVQSQLLGLVLIRYILKIEPLASLPPEELITYLAPTLQRYLTGDLSITQGLK